LRVRYRPY